MVCCCIYGCGNSSNKNKGIGFYLIPKTISWQCSKTYNLSSERRTLWLKRINRHNFNEKTIEGSRVCGAHFVSGKPSALFDSNNPDWAPSLELGYDDGEELEFRRGRWVRRKKKKTIEPELVKKSTETFIMLDNIECTSDTLKLLKKKSKIVLDSDAVAGCSHEDLIESKNNIEDNDDKNLINGIKKRSSRIRKDAACQTDIKCEYIGHLETHVVYLRDEVQNLKQQIEQYEAYYEMMSGNSSNSGKDATQMMDNSCEADTEPEAKRYKPTSNPTQNNDEQFESDDDLSPLLIPQVIIKTEPEDADIVISEEETKEHVSESEDISTTCQENLNDAIEQGDSTDAKCMVAAMKIKTEISSSTSEEQTTQVRKSKRPRKSTTAFDGEKIGIESLPTKTRPRPVTAYTLWSTEKRLRIAKEYPDIDSSGVAKFLSELWKEVPKEEKLTWRNKASKEKKGKT